MDSVLYRDLMERVEREIGKYKSQGRLKDICKMIRKHLKKIFFFIGIW